MKSQKHIQFTDKELALIDKWSKAAEEVPLNDIVIDRAIYLRLYNFIHNMKREPSLETDDIVESILAKWLQNKSS